MTSKTKLVNHLLDGTKTSSTRNWLLSLIFVIWLIAISILVAVTILVNSNSSLTDRVPPFQIGIGMSSNMFSKSLTCCLTPSDTSIPSGTLPVGKEVEEGAASGTVLEQWRTA
jgi:hypothetical protein